MPTSFTTNLRLSNPGLGDTGWGSTVSNGMIDLTDQAISGTTSVSVTAGNVTLTSLNGVADQARQMFLVATGTPGVPRDVIVPSTSKLYFVKNDANDTVTFKVLGQPGVAVPAGSAMALRVNGTDVVVAQDQFVTLKASGTTTLAALTASGNVSFDGGTFVFNESGADKDARFEGDTDANLLFLDASTDRVGIGTAAPAAKLDVQAPAGTAATQRLLTGSSAAAATLSFGQVGAVQWDIGLLASAGNYQIAINTGQTAYTIARSGTAVDYHAFSAGGSERMRLDSSGNVGIGTATPAAKLDVNGPASVTSFTGSTRLGVTVKGSTAATDYSGIDFSGNNQIVPTARIAVLSAASGSSLVFGTSSDYATGITNTALTIDFLGNIISKVNGTAPTLSTNSTMSFELTSNTSLRIVVRGTDGTTRSVSLTLA